MNREANADGFEPVVKEIEVACAPVDAWRIFTEGIAEWWPLATHSCFAGDESGDETAALCVIEPHVDGRIYERGSNGTEHEWGVVTAWEPPARLVFSWHPSRNPGSAQTVEVSFTGTESGTCVKLVHTGWERWGNGAKEARNGYETGWEMVFTKCYGERANL